MFEGKVVKESLLLNVAEVFRPGGTFFDKYKSR